MIALQIVTSICWFGVMGYMLPSLARVLTGRGRGNDAIWAVMWFLALNRFCFNFTAIAIPHLDLVRVINYTCSIIGAVLLFGVAKSER